jgi:hypothetical protein
MLKKSQMALTLGTKKGPTCGKMAGPFKLATWIHAFRSELMKRKKADF